MVGRDTRVAVYHQFQNGQRLTVRLDPEAYKLARDLQRQLGSAHAEIAALKAELRKQETDNVEQPGTRAA